jgi:hypothetical protein
MIAASANIYSNSKMLMRVNFAFMGKMI